MKSAKQIKEHLLPWAGLIGILIGWALTHQIGSNTAFDRCQVTSPLPMALLGLAGLVVIILGGLLSWGVWRRGEGETQARRFLGLISAGASALLGVALVFQTISSFIIPQCFG